MKNYKNKGEHIIIERHFIIIFMKFLKTFIYVFFAIIIYLFYLKYKTIVDAHEGLNVFIFIVLFILLNYGFFKFLSYLIIYVNNVIFLFRDQFVIIKCSLIMKDDIENIDIYKIIKVDSFSRGFFSNMLGYGSFIIEQQKNDVRTFDYISNPHKLLKIFEQQREKYKTKKYVKV